MAIATDRDDYKSSPIRPAGLEQEHVIETDEALALVTLLCSAIASAILALSELERRAKLQGA